MQPSKILAGITEAWDSNITLFRLKQSRNNSLPRLLTEAGIVISVSPDFQKAFNCISSRLFESVILFKLEQPENDFNLNEAYTYIRVDADASIDFKFIPAFDLSVIAEGYNGRMHNRNIIYHGYWWTEARKWEENQKVH
jgi:hypothetical protein